MKNTNPNETGKPPEQALIRDGSKETTPDPFQKDPLAGGTRGKVKAEPKREAEQGISEIVMVWLFIAILVLGSVVAAYALWAKLDLRDR